MDVRCAAAHSRNNAPPRAPEQDKRSVTQVILTRTCSPVKDFGCNVPGHAAVNGRSRPEPSEGSGRATPEGVEATPSRALTEEDDHPHSAAQTRNISQTCTLREWGDRNPCPSWGSSPRSRASTATVTVPRPRRNHQTGTRSRHQYSVSRKPLPCATTRSGRRPVRAASDPSCRLSYRMYRKSRNPPLRGELRDRRVHRRADQPSDLSASEAENMRSGSRPSKYAPISSARPAGVHCASASKRCSTTGAAMSATIGP